MTATETQQLATPMLHVNGVREAIAFYGDVFDAVELRHHAMLAWQIPGSGAEPVRRDLGAEVLPRPFLTTFPRCLVVLRRKRALR